MKIRLVRALIIVLDRVLVDRSPIAGCFFFKKLEWFGSFCGVFSFFLSAGHILF